MGKVRFWDIVALILALAVLTVSALWAYGPKSEPSEVRIKSGNETYIYPLSRNGEYPIPGILGDTVVRVRDGSAEIISSPCPNKTCMGHSISDAGSTLVCLPNGVIVSIEGGSYPEVDDVAT